jgi:TRAP-type uncharacterized transport system fused permease subunit
MEGVWVVLTGFIGMTFFVIGNQGYMLTRMNGVIGWTARIAMMVAGYLLLTTPLLNDAIGFGIFVLVYLWQMWERSREQAALAAA